MNTLALLPRAPLRCEEAASDGAFADENETGDSQCVSSLPTAAVRTSVPSRQFPYLSCNRCCRGVCKQRGAGGGHSSSGLPRSAMDSEFVPLRGSESVGEMESDYISDSQIASILGSDEEFSQRVESDEEGKAEEQAEEESEEESPMDIVFRKVEDLVMDEGRERKKSVSEIVQELGKKSAVLKKVLESRLDGVEERIAALEIR